MEPEKQIPKPAMIAAKNVLLPLLEILAYLCLGISIFAAVNLKKILYSGIEPTGFSYTLALWSQQALQNGVFALGLLLGFISILALPFKKKIFVAALIILTGYLTRGLLS